MIFDIIKILKEYIIILISDIIKWLSKWINVIWKIIVIKILKIKSKIILKNINNKLKI